MSPSEPMRIALAGPGDMACLARALESLSADLGDTHRAREEVLARACLGPHPACHGFVARAGNDLLGAALVSPVFSTTYGAAGVYVSDLWVSDACRGQGLGRRLLRSVAGFAKEHWQARFLKLTVYDENAGARAFYDRLGFDVAERNLTCLMDPPAFDSLLGETG